MAHGIAGKGICLKRGQEADTPMRNAANIVWVLDRMERALAEQNELPPVLRNHD